jgi:hypothetical protein
MSDTATSDTATSEEPAFDPAAFEANGQKAIVDLATQVLEQAKSGEFTALLVTTVHKNGQIGSVWSSYTGGFLWLLGMCEVAKARVLSFMTPAPANERSEAGVEAPPAEETLN